MKRGTADHPKMLMLTRELEKIYAAHKKKSSFGGKAEALGLLELLWEWASKYAIQGDIGKWPNDAISSGIGWKYSGDELISALVESKWVDKVEGCARLVIHDIEDHATNSWRQNLEDAGLTWWNGSPPRKYKLQKNSSKTPENSRKTPQAEPKPKPEAEPYIPSEKIQEFPKPKKGMLDPSKGFDFEAAFERLYETHDGHARYRDCKAALQSLMVDRTNPEDVCTSMQTSADQWNGYWRATGRSPTGLLNWILSGDWEKRPPPIQQKAAHSRNQEAERLFMEGR